jgi:hypothetical protein
MFQYRDRWRTLVNAVMNLRVPKIRGISWLTANRLASQEGLCSMEWVSKKVYQCVTVHIVLCLVFHNIVTSLSAAWRFEVWFWWMVVILNCYFSLIDGTCGPLQRIFQTTGGIFSARFVSLDRSRHLIKLRND